MEEYSQISPRLAFSADKDDGKYLSGLSTVLVATIQEVKDRISQIEHIFCGELFPSFQSKSKILEESFAEAKRTEDEWRKKEKSLLFIIEELQFEKKHIIEQNQHLIASFKLKLMNNDELVGEELTNEKRLLEKPESVGISEGVDEFQEHIRHGIEELARIKSFGEKASQMVNSEQVLNEHQLNMLLSTMKSAKERVFELQYKLEYKTREVAEGKEKQANLLKMLESSYTVELVKDRLLQELLSNKEMLLSKIKSLEKTISELQLDLLDKAREVADGKDLQQKLSRKLESEDSEIRKTNQLLDEHESNKIRLLSRIKSMEKNVDDLQHQLTQKSLQVAQLTQSREKLLKNVQLSVFRLQYELKLGTEDMVEGKKLEEKLLGVVESKSSQIVDLKAKLEIIKDNANELKEELQRKTREAVERRNEHEKDKKMFLEKTKCLEENLAHLQYELQQKTEEMTESKKLHDKLRGMVESKASLIEDLLAKLDSAKVNANEVKEELRKKMEEEDERRNEHGKDKEILLEKTKNLEENVAHLQYELKCRTEEMAEEKKMHEKLLGIVESKASQIVDLRAKLESVEKNANELKELRVKTEEMDLGRKFPEKLVQQIELKTSDILQDEHLCSKHEKKKKLLQERVKSLEFTVDELQNKYKKKTEEVPEGKKLQEELLQKVESAVAQITKEKWKNKEIIASYKSLKSQYNFLCSKFGLTAENTLHNRMGEESDSSRLHHSHGVSQEIENKDPDTPGFTSNMNRQKNEINLQEELEKDGKSGLNHCSSSHSPASGSSSAPTCPTSVQPKLHSGIKRPYSEWRDTRSAGGRDLHHDFLCTPMENIKANLNMASKGEIPDFPVPAPDGMDPESSDDETQDIHVDPAPKRHQISTRNPEEKKFKYVEPVRKKAEREKLKGIECKQCKKFYDAVLPDGEGLGTDNISTRSFRCEHHDGVSRHRYKYIPPMTPEGFWNIGFDSDI
ncbi:protein gamma response 1 [Macadamia integrifolia]|uniref:protein gamma response 1 n=1 Tax=Macadamia integrifolia TaxID=60698 RepID=UPI001C4F0750|nr:protein gamma response 1 [Macadamia integrifolia]